MAIAGSIAGPLFNLLIGFGASLIKSNISLKGPVPFVLYTKSNIISSVVMGLAFLNILRLLILTPFQEFRLTKSAAIIGYVIYTVFLVAIVLITFIKI